MIFGYVFLVVLAALAVISIVRRHKREMRKIAALGLYAARRTEKARRRLRGQTYQASKWTGLVYTAKAEDVMRQSVSGRGDFQTRI